MRIIPLFTLIILLSGCTKCWDCSNSCYKCKNLVNEFCSTDFVTTTQYETIKNDIFSNDSCWQIASTKTQYFCNNKSLASTLEDSNYVCNQVK